MTWGTPVQSFVFLGLLVFELEPMYATSDRQTDGQTTDADDRLMPPPPLRGRGHNNLHALTAITAPLYTADSDISVCYLPFNARRKNELNRTVTQMTDRLVAALASDLQHYPV